MTFAVLSFYLFHSVSHNKRTSSTTILSSGICIEEEGGVRMMQVSHCRIRSTHTEMSTKHFYLYSRFSCYIQLNSYSHISRRALDFIYTWIVFQIVLKFKYKIEKKESNSKYLQFN